MLFRTIVLVLSCSVVIFGAPKSARHLPSYLIPCKASDPELNKCVMEHAEEAIPFLLKGDPKFKLPVLTPLKLEKTVLKPNNQLTLILEDIAISGIEFVHVSNANFDLKKQHVKLGLVTKNLKLNSQYNINGQLIVPIAGQGPIEIDFTDVHILYEFDYKLQTKKDNKTYVSNLTPSIDFQVKAAHYKLDNLFNGNKELGDATNKLLNENSLEVLKDFGPAISEIIKSIATTILKAFLYTVPFNQIFTP